MSQTPSRTCTQCGTPITPGHSFCPDCGTPVQEASTRTAASTPYPPPNATPYPPLDATPYSQPNAMPYPPFPVSTDPYASTVPNSMQNDMPPPPPPYTPQPSGSSYNYMPIATPPPVRKKRSPLLFIITGVVALILILGGAGIFALINAATHGSGTHTTNGGGVNSSGGNGGGVNGGSGSGNGGNSGGGNSGGGNSGGGSSGGSQQVNVTTVYASDQLTFTSIQQAAKFSDDDFTSYSEHPNYVRISFKEQQLSKESSFFSYTQAFHLVLPDKSVVASEKAQQYTGPEQGVVRTNWIDFGTGATIDLSQLTLRLGGQDEAQLDIPLKTGADVSKYQPKTSTVNKQFTYATMNWTLQSATQSLYFNGNQAKSGQVYITATLVASNPGSNELFLDNFMRLKAGGSTVAPDYGSDTTNFDIIKPATSNVKGSVTFLVTLASTYTLNFLASSDNSFAAQSVDFQIA